MSVMTKKNFAAADETRTPDKTVVEAVSLGDGIRAARVTMDPGWRWSQCIKPIVGTESCRARHIGALVTGEVHVSHDDGTQTDLRPGDAYVIEPGHDAWVTGDHQAVVLEFETITAATYARPSRSGE